MDNAGTLISQEHAHSSHVWLREQRSSDSSGYKSESEGSKLGERVWAKDKNCVIPLHVSNQKIYFQKSKSLDCDGYHDNMGEEGRTRTNTLPNTSPSRTRLTAHPNSTGPGPRRSYLTAVESSKTGHVYETVQKAPHSDEATTDGPIFRRLHFDENTGAFCQAKPPALPPKLKKKAESVDEPVYAEVDKTKKQSRRGVNAYTKAHRAIITVCKQRMEEEEVKKSSQPPEVV